MNEISVNTYVEARFQVRYYVFLFLIINNDNQFIDINCLIFTVVQECITIAAFSYSRLQFWHWFLTSKNTWLDISLKSCSQMRDTHVLFKCKSSIRENISLPRILNCKKRINIVLRECWFTSLLVHYNVFKCLTMI